MPPTGSGFGGKHAADLAVGAARLARAAGHPVRIVYTRAEEFTQAYFRPMAVIDIRSGAEKDGTLTAWQFDDLNAGSAAARTPYKVPNQKIGNQPAESPLAQASYRALAATANNFARESHMDELAARVGADPVDTAFATWRTTVWPKSSGPSPSAPGGTPIAPLRTRSEVEASRWGSRRGDASPRSPKS